MLLCRASNALMPLIGDLYAFFVSARLSSAQGRIVDRTIGSGPGPVLRCGLAASDVSGRRATLDIQAGESPGQVEPESLDVLEFGVLA